MNNHTRLIIGIVVLLGIVIGTIFLLRVIPSEGLREAEESRVIRDPSSTEDSRQDDTDLTETSCTDAGGTWNPCGSACRTQPDAVCIELCVEYCECQSDAQCPNGFSCGDFVEGVGVCL